MTYISLGGNCSIAYHLKLRGKTTRYPFDWCNITINQLNNVLENSFENFLNLKFHKLSKNHENFQNLENKSYILKNDYNIKFAHEISHKYNLKDFQLVLQKRINKFLNVTEPVFIRLEINNISQNYFEKQYKKLIQNLFKYFKNFKLIIISKNNSFTFKKNISFIKLDKFSEDWKYTSINWNKIIEI